METAVRRVLYALATVTIVIVFGGLVLYWLGKGRWTVGDGVYMAAISAATVGFSELPGLGEVTGARLVTVVIIMLGIGSFAFFQSSLTAFFVEGALGEAFRRRRMEKLIATLENHVVVAGCGSTGRHIVTELLATRTPFVVIDRNREEMEALNRENGDRVPYVIGDATHDEFLKQAGVARASGVIAALTDDRDNLYVTLSVRAINPKARIVAKVVAKEAVPKMISAGADATVSPNTIGGIRMASEMLRPSVVEFLDLMLRDKERNFRIEEVGVPGGSHLIGMKLKDAPIHEATNTLVMALREPSGKLRYNPNREHLIDSGTVLIVMGEVADVQRLRAYVKEQARATGT